MSAVCLGENLVRETSYIRQGSNLLSALEASALESVRVDRVDCIYYLSLLQDSGTPAQSFHDFHMDLVTSSFANDLDTLRKVCGHDILSRVYCRVPKYLKR